MTTPPQTRARVAALTAPAKATPDVSFQQSDLGVIAQHMYSLMFRNIASEGYVFEDPVNPGSFSSPGCVLAAPSYPANTPGTDQDYVFHWIRDAAIAALEIAAANVPWRPDAAAQSLIDYVRFTQTCQENAKPTPGHACFTISGQPRPWSEQNDGPAFQVIAILKAFDQLDASTQNIGRSVVAKSVDYLLEVYQEPTTNLWEEHAGYSFFTRSVQLRSLKAFRSNPRGIPVPPQTDAAITWLQGALRSHWNGSVYVSVLPAPGYDPPPEGYDPNIDIISASIYGAVPVTETKLLATAAKLRGQWEDDSSPACYPVNIADKALGIGPLLGRYPGDTYDNDVAPDIIGEHPWALSTCNLAELYYSLANEIAANGRVPFNDLSAPFFSQVGVTDTTLKADAVKSLRSAGDALLHAVVYHSDNLELSEQFDGVTGYEKSVKNLTWSYAAFLSAVRAKTGQRVEG